MLSLLIISSCTHLEKQDKKMKEIVYKYKNKLINESSPYLLQHAHNPVNWYPWGEESLEKAKNEQKLLIISIGYAACHWCHVMEEESFENEIVAKFMNENFVAIKVDREERPDLDRIYMDAIQLLTGRGGWPLNIIAFPDGRPLYGGTYFPKDQWLSVLSQVLNYVRENPEKAEVQAEALTNGVRNTEIIELNKQKPAFTIDDLNSVFSVWQEGIDMVNGGQKGAPKFPMPSGFQFLLHYNFLTGNDFAQDSIQNSLIKMAQGGIYDQIGGGFARYSVDDKWKIPHFEKMLYDNAQLVSLYSKAYQQKKNPLFKTIVMETLTFIDRELTSPDGIFYSSLDADSDGEEGKFYVWTQSEIEETLGSRAADIIEYYNITETGNWEEGKNILHITDSEDKPDGLEKTKSKLLKSRSLRIRPALDDKALTAWNALLINAYVDAYRAFDMDEYLEKAKTAAIFILDNIKTGEGRLNRNYKEGTSSINAFLDDYAFVIEAFVTLYEATFNEFWLMSAEDLLSYALDHFYDNKKGMFFYTSDLDPDLIARKMEVVDNVIYSSNSQMAKNLYKMGHYLFNDDYIRKSETMLNNVKKSALHGSLYFANWDILMAWFASEPYEVAIVGENFESIRKEFDENYLPHIFFSGGRDEGSLELLKYKLVKGQTTIYVCRGKICQKPVTSVEEALKQIE